MICQEIQDALHRAGGHEAQLGVGGKHPMDRERVRPGHSRHSSIAGHSRQGSVKCSPDGCASVVGKQAMGYVVNLREDYAFIKCVSWRLLSATMCVYGTTLIY